MITNFLKKAARNSTKIESAIFTLGLPLLVCIILISLLRLAFNLGYYYSAFGCDGYANPSCYVSFGGGFLIFIVAGLCLVALGLWRRTRKGLWLATVGLAWVAATCFLWYAGPL